MLPLPLANGRRNSRATASHETPNAMMLIDHIYFTVVYQQGYRQKCTGEIATECCWISMHWMFQLIPTWCLCSAGDHTKIITHLRHSTSVALAIWLMCHLSAYLFSIVSNYTNIYTRKDITVYVPPNEPRTTTSSQSTKLNWRMQAWKKRHMPRYVKNSSIALTWSKLAVL